MNALVSSTRNALGNARNSFQGTRRRVLCVCSAGLLRSPTVARVLAETLDYNTRACGTARDFALIPISEVLVSWADEIVFVQATNFLDIEYDQGFRKYANGKTITVMSVPDVFEYMDEDLVRIVMEEYQSAKQFVFGE